jgi:hypothetical protein
MFKPKIVELALFATGAGAQLIYAALVYSQWGFTYLYQDGISHTFISKVSWQNPTNLIGVWLPLPHLLMMPFVLDPFLYSSGFAGTIVNCVAVGLTSVLLYRLIGSWYGIAAGVIYATNILTLAYSTTVLTEPMALFFALWAVLQFRSYLRDEKRIDFLKTCLILCAGELVRYEIWALALALVIIYVVNEINRGRPYNVALVHVAFWGIFLWLFAEVAVFRNPLEFLYPSLGSPFGVGGLAAPSSFNFNFVLVFVLEKVREAVEIAIIVGISAYLSAFYFARRRKPAPNPKSPMQFLALCLIAIYLVSLPVQFSFFLNGAPVDRLQKASTYEEIQQLKELVARIEPRIQGNGMILVSNTPLAPVGYASALSVLGGIPTNDLIDEYSPSGLFYNASAAPWNYARYVVVSHPFDPRWAAEQSYYGAYFNYLYYTNETWYNDFILHYGLSYNGSNVLVYELGT